MRVAICPAGRKGKQAAAGQRSFTGIKHAESRGSGSRYDGWSACMNGTCRPRQRAAVDLNKAGRVQVTQVRVAACGKADIGIGDRIAAAVGSADARGRNAADVDRCTSIHRRCTAANACADRCAHPGDDVERLPDGSEVQRDRTPGVDPDIAIIGSHRTKIDVGRCAKLVVAGRTRQCQVNAAFAAAYGKLAEITDQSVAGN